MYLCDDNHEQIVYEGGLCPMCDLLNENNELQTNNDELTSQCKDLEDELEDLRK